MICRVLKIITMKCLSLSVLLLAGTLSLSAQQGRFALRIHWAAPGWVYLNYRSGSSYLRDSIAVKDGQISYSGTLTKTDLTQVTVSTSFMPDLADPNTITLFVGAGDKISIDVSSKLSSAAISGSSASSGFRDLQADLDTALAKAAGDSFTDQVDNPVMLPILKKYIEAHPNSSIGFHALTWRGRFDPLRDTSLQQLEAVRAVYMGLSARVRGLPEVKAFGDKLQLFAKLVIGAKAPDFSSKTIEDQPVRLSQYKGKYVLLDFWASWCIPCRREFPYLKKAYARFRDKNFEILGYSIDKDRSLWESAVNNDDASWVQVSNIIGYSDPIAVEYGIAGVPSNWLIDPSGTIIARNLRGEEVEKKIASLIK